MAKKSIVTKLVLITVIIALVAIGIMSAIMFSSINSIKESSLEIGKTALEEKNNKHMQDIIEYQAKNSERSLEDVKNMVLTQEKHLLDVYYNQDNYIYNPQKIDTSFIASMDEQKPLNAPYDLQLAPFCDCVVSYDFINIQARQGVDIKYDTAGNIVSSNQAVTEEIRKISPITQSFKDAYDTSKGKVLWIYFGSANGIFYGYPGNGPMPAEYDCTQREWYISAVEKKDFVWSDPYIDVTTNKLTITAAKPVYDKDGKLLGVIAADVTIDTINKEISGLKISDQGYSYLIDGKGSIVAKPDYVSGNVQWNEVFKSESMLDTANPELNQLTQRMVKGEKGTAIITDNGQQKYVAFAPISSLGWSMATVVPADEALQSVANIETDITEKTKDIILFSILIVLATIIVVVAVSIIFAKRIAVPIKRLTEAGNKVVDGDIKEEVPQVKTGDEIEDLSNTMTMLVGAVRFLRNEQKPAGEEKEKHHKKSEK